VGVDVIVGVDVLVNVLVIVGVSVSVEVNVGVIVSVGIFVDVFVGVGERKDELHDWRKKDTTKKNITNGIHLINFFGICPPKRVLKLSLVNWFSCFRP
jgi:hypothetical protein